VTDSDEPRDGSTCGCCSTVDEDTPHTNQPGQPSLRYRIGTHGAFLRRMVRRLPFWETLDGSGPTRRPLAKLTTQETSDPSVALLDAFAVMADVLTFYQERIANECYLRTATERRSVLELAREISYELKPGVAAGTSVAFTDETSKGAPESVTIMKGTKVQSLPAPGKLPQTFETSDDLVARPEWNALKPRIKTAQTITGGMSSIILKGIDSGIRSGDGILFVETDPGHYTLSSKWQFRKITRITVNTASMTTILEWQAEGGEIPVSSKVYLFRQRANLFGHNAPDWVNMPDEIKKRYVPDYDSTASLGSEKNPREWPNLKLCGNLAGSDADERGIYIDVVSPGIIPNNWGVLSSSGTEYLFIIKTATEESQTDFTLTAKTTRLVFLSVSQKPLSQLPCTVRETVVFCQSEPAPLAEVPETTAIESEKDTLIIDGSIQGLTEGKRLIISGMSAKDGKPVSEDLILSNSVPGTATTTLTFADKFLNSYKRDTVTIYANVVPVTHGETVNEVLGSGNAGIKNQQFVLKKPPLTYVQASTPSGGKSTLSVRVDGLEWSEVATPYGKKATDENYQVRINDDTSATVIFGDGKRGARPTTGSENITAVYRSGTGPDGNVAQGTLSLLTVRPAGIREVTNPVAATGAAPPEERDHARRNAPIRVRTFDRVVSLQDYEDYARAYTGIAKAKAVGVWSGEEHCVQVTVAGPDGNTVDDVTVKNLEDSIREFSDPGHPVSVKSYTPVFFTVDAEVTFDVPRYKDDAVRLAIKTALLATFSFDNRSFGQDVTDSEIIRTIQDIPGVISVQNVRIRKLSAPAGDYLDRHILYGGKPFFHPDKGQKRIRAAYARYYAGTIECTEILQISQDGITINGVKL
jgi:hypothetical protein